MPPRIPILGVLRQRASCLGHANLSTSVASQSLRKDVPRAAPRGSATTTASSLLDMGASPAATSSDSTTMARDLYGMMRGSQARQRRLREQDQQQQGGSPTRSIDRDLLDKHAAADYQRQLTRRWKAGDVYAPHDMSAGEMGKWRRTSARKQDLVDLLGLHPLDMYRNFSVMSEFMTPHGRMKRAVETGLRPVNQRKMAKAVRRAIGLGLHPSVHRHPELLLREVVRQRPQHMATIFDHKV